MGTDHSSLQLIIANAYTDLRNGGCQARIVMVRRVQLLVLGSRLGRRATVNGKPLLQAAPLAIKDSLGAPLIIQEHILHLGVFLAKDGMLVSLTSHESYVFLRGRLRAIDRVTWRWLVEQQRLVDDLNLKLRKPGPVRLSSVN